MRVGDLQAKLDKFDDDERVFVDDDGRLMRPSPTFDDRVEGVVL